MPTPDPTRTMRHRYSLLALLLAFVGTGILSAEVRTWTLESTGKTFEAEYVDAEEDRVLKGKEKHIKLTRLSEEDQEFIRGLAEQNAETRENSNFSGKWPVSTLMEDKLRAKAVKEEDAEGQYIYETTHFRFYSPEKLAITTVSEMGRVFEGTYTACRAMPLNFPCRRFDSADDEEAAAEGEEAEKLVARLFRTQADYAREVGSGYAQSAGLFRGTEILVPFPSLGIEKKGSSYAISSGSKLETGTLIHELTHQMSLLGVSYDVPIWFAEGIAEYTRLATYKRGRFSFKGVKKNMIPYIVGGPGTAGRQLGKRFAAPPLEQVMNMSVREFQAAQGDQIQFNYGFSALLAYYFIHLDGKGDAARLKRWMRHLQTTERATANLSIKIPADASPSEIAAARRQLQNRAMSIRENYYYDSLLDGRSWEELEKEFTKKVKKELGVEVSFGD